MTDKVLTKTTKIEEQGWKLTSVLIDLKEKKMVETWQVPPPPPRVETWQGRRYDDSPLKEKKSRSRSPKHSPKTPE